VINFINRLEQAMKYGNCLIGAIILLLQHRGKLVVLWRGRIIPHLMVKSHKDGYYYHYKLVRDIFPPPFCYLCFQGMFVRQKRIFCADFERV
jgi:hypothetical protein